MSKNQEKNQDQVAMAIQSLNQVHSTTFSSLDEAILYNETVLNEQTGLILQLQTQLASKTAAGGRKSEVLDLLKKHGAISIMSIANKLGISTKNVSSQLTYLRSDGYRIFTDHRGLKCLAPDPVNEFDISNMV